MSHPKSSLSNTLTFQIFQCYMRHLVSIVQNNLLTYVTYVNQKHVKTCTLHALDVENRKLTIISS